MHETKTFFARVNKDLIAFRPGVSVGIFYLAYGKNPKRKVPPCTSENSTSCRITIGTDSMPLAKISPMLEELKKEYGSISKAINLSLAWIHDFAPHYAETEEDHIRAVNYWRERNMKEAEATRALKLPEENEDAQEG